MAFLAPLFFVGLAALAVPIVLHMIQRQRKDVVPFPSLMFLRQVPFRSFRRQRIRHWFLLLLRCAALALLIAAFARPFFRNAALAAGTLSAREVVILLDQSYSMGYGARWDEARAAARGVVDALGPEDRATVVLFDSGAQTGPRSTTERISLTRMLDDAVPGSGVTRYGPALKLAEGIFAESSLSNREAVLISDFQRIGIDSAAGIQFPGGTIVTPMPIGEGDGAIDNVSVAGVLFDREQFSGRERVVVSARLTNRGSQPVDDLDIVLELAGRDVETVRTSLPAHESALVDFAPVTLGDMPIAGAVRTSGDSLPTDDAFYFVTSPGQVIRVLVVGSSRSAEADALYLNRALAIGASPAFDVRMATMERLQASDFEGQQVVVLNDAPPPGDAIAGALEAFVRAGGGLLVALGERSAWSAEAAGLLPGTVGIPTDRAGRGGVIGVVDYSHPVFELFAQPRSGDVASARFFRYRPIEPAEASTVLARFDDGEPALVEQRVDDGRVLLWASTLDNFWNDLALKPVYLPFVHQIVEYLADYAPPVPWRIAGQVLDLTESGLLLADAGLDAAELVAITPSGRVMPIDGTEDAGFLALREQGLYTLRDATGDVETEVGLAVNVDLSESDLATVDPSELASQLTGAAGGQAAGVSAPRDVTVEELERRQGVWWYVLVAACGLFVAEALVSNRLSRTVLELE